MLLMIKYDMSLLSKSCNCHWSLNKYALNMYVGYYRMLFHVFFFFFSFFLFLFLISLLNNEIFSDISFASEVFSAGLHFMHHMCLKQNYKKKKKRIITCWNLWCVNGQI